MPTVLLTRPVAQVTPLRAAFLAAGWDVLCQPAIEILPLATESKTMQRELPRADWWLFSSGNGVRFFYKHCDFIPRIAAVGRETARMVEEILGHRVQLIPPEATAVSLANALREDASNGAHFLSIRGSRGGETLRESLTQFGGRVTELIVYESRDVTTADPTIVQAMRDGAIDTTVVTSSASAQSLRTLFGEALRQTRLVAIGSVTAQSLTSLGFHPAAVAAYAETDALVAACKEIVGDTAFCHFDGA